MFKPRPQQTPVEWCESQLALNSLATSYPGPYSTRMTPYVREILGGLVDYNIERVICCFGAQTSKTNTYMAAVAWLMANEPGPVMWVMPNKNLAADFSERRLQPFLLSSAEIRGATTGKRNDIKRTEMTFSTATLTLVGSNSPANLASRPVRYLFLDEVDKFPGATKKEANAVDLATERTRSFPERKIFLSSTPTIADATIWQEYLNGDQRRYFVPCPHCGKSILLVFNPQRTAFTELLGCEVGAGRPPPRRLGLGARRVHGTLYLPVLQGRNPQRVETRNVAGWAVATDKRAIFGRGRALIPPADLLRALAERKLGQTCRRISESQGVNRGLAQLYQLGLRRTRHRTIRGRGRRAPRTHHSYGNGGHNNPALADNDG